MAVKAENVPGAGDVTFMLGGQEVTLRCTPGAALRLSRLPGGLWDVDNDHADTVARRVRRLSVDTMADVIRAGLGIGNNAVPDLGEQIYEFGLLGMSGQLWGYIVNLANGGKPLGSETKEGGDGEDPPKSEAE